MNNHPSGTATFLFTDIEGSTKLAQEHLDEMPALLRRHHEIFYQAVQNQKDYMFQIGGDSFSAAFHSSTTKQHEDSHSACAPVEHASADKDPAIIHKQLNDATHANLWENDSTSTLEQAMAFALEESCQQTYTNSKWRSMISILRGNVPPCRKSLRTLRGNRTSFCHMTMWQRN